MYGRKYHAGKDTTKRTREREIKKREKERVEKKEKRRE